MKTKQIIIILVLSISILDAETVGDFIVPDKSTGDLEMSDETKRAFKLESEADLTGWYSTDGKLDIGIGRMDKEEGVRYPIKFSLDELERFFDDQRRKDLIVVTVAKHVWTDEELNSHVNRLRDYFIERGYKRIVIEQAYASSRGIHLDHSSQDNEKKQNKSEMATPRKPSD